MQLKRVITVARYERRLLGRNWIVRILLVWGIIAIIGEQYLLQGDQDVNRFMIALPGAIPYVNTYLFTLLQSILVILAVVEWRRREKSRDTLESGRVRSVGNTEYLWGKGLGIIVLLSIFQLFSLLLAMGINLFASESPFCFWDYPFYWSTLSFPALIFMTGLSIFVTGWIRNTGLGLVVLFTFFLGTLYYLTDLGHGIWDFTSTDIPNVFSDVTDCMGIIAYISYRFIYLTLGVGLLLWSIGGECRLPNGRKEIRYGYLMGAVLVMLGSGTGIFHSVRYWQDETTRKIYLKFALQHTPSPFIRVNRHDLEVEQKGNQILGKSRLEIINRDKSPVEQWVLYLNPGLQIISFNESSGQSVEYDRENQIVVVKRPLKGGDTCTFSLTYKGKIDERVCYLEVPSADYWHMQWYNCPMRFGKRYAFVGDKYTLLTPECLWYPVAVSPVNLSFLHATGKDFTDFRLRVFDPSRRSVVSQGERIREGDSVRFYNWQRLQGVTLCMGNFESRSVRVDSVMFELYSFKGHDQLSPLFKNMTTEEFQNVLKRSMGRLKLKDYPFRKLVMLETPVSFAVNSRSWKSVGECVQPELVLFPERWYPVRWMNVKNSFRSFEENYQRQLTMGIVSNRSFEEEFLAFFIYYLTSQKVSMGINNVFIPAFAEGFRVPRLEPNGQYVSPLFFNYSGYFFSNDYPIMDKVMFTLLERKRAGRADFNGSDEMLKADRYLSTRSLEDALRDTFIPDPVFEAILMLKMNYIKDYVSLSIPEKEFYLFVEEFKSLYPFQEMDFNEFMRKLKSEKGVDLEKILPDWFRGREIPAYLIKDIGVDKVITDEEEDMYRVRFKIKNTGKVDGIVNLSLSLADFDKMTYCYFIPAGESKEIKKLVKTKQLNYELNLNLSSNIPHGYTEVLYKEPDEVRDTADGIFDIDDSVFAPAPDEFIVDNEDPGFQLVEADKRQRLFEKESRKEKKYQFDYIALCDMGQLLPTRWTYCAGSSGIYGNVVRSLVYKKAGEGKAKAIWKTDLPKSGVYELFVYIGAYQVRMDGEPVQNYELTDRDGIRQVSVKTEEGKGWLSLGEFDLSAGENQIVLSDKGVEEEQVIYADAVKWKFMGDK